MDVTGPSTRPQTTNEPTLTTEEQTPSAPAAPVETATISYNPDAISTATIMAILALQNQQSIELNSDQQLVRNGETIDGQQVESASKRNADTINALVSNEDGSDLFTRIETAKQGRMSKADGKMSRDDLVAALAHGGLSADERATAEYLLANFDQMKTGDFITKESLKAYSLGLSSTNDPATPFEGLQSFVDGGDGKGLKNRGMDSDFKDLANGKRNHSVSMEDLQKGLSDPDFSPEQKAAIQYMIDNFDTIAHGNDTISFKELDTFVSGLQQGLQANAQAKFESFPIAAAVLMDMGLTEVSKEELDAIIQAGTNSDGTPFTQEQLTALSSTLGMFDAIADENGKVSVTELNALGVGPEQGLAYFAAEEGAFKDIAGSDRMSFEEFMGASLRDIKNHESQISREDLDNAINSGKYDGAQKAALIHLRNNFDAIAGENGQISHAELQRAAATVSSSENLRTSQQSNQMALESAVAHAGTFSESANDLDFLVRLDRSHLGDDRDYQREDLIEIIKGTDVEADRSTFIEAKPISIFGMDIGTPRENAPDGKISRNDLVAALESSNFSEAEKAFMRVTLENFSEISGGSNTISNEQMQEFAAQFQVNQQNSFDSISQDETPTVPLNA